MADYNSIYTGAEIDSAVGEVKDKNFASPIALNGDYFSPYAMRNKFINGGFDIWQRNVDNATSSGYKGADRMYYGQGAGNAYTIAKTTIGSGNKTVFSSGQTVNDNTQYFIVGQKIEFARNIMSGKTMTFSGSVRANNASIAGKAITYTVRWISSNYGVTDHTETFTTHATSLSFEDNTFSSTFAVPLLPALGVSDYYVVDIIFQSGDATGLSNGDSFFVANLQLEEGSVATPFEQRPIGLELSLCQRYFYEISGAQYASKVGLNSTTTVAAQILVQFPTTMRVNPTATRTESNITISAVSTTTNYGRFYGTPTSATSTATIDTATFDAEL